MKTTASVACLICFVLFSTCLAQTCTKTGPCSCQNTQGTLDLSPLAYGDGTPRFRDVPGLNGLQYSYNPCVGFSEGSGPCELVALCMINGSMSYSLGAANSTVYKSVGGGWQLVYTSMGMPQRVSTITLVCDPTVDGNFTVQGEMPQGSAKYVEKRLFHSDVHNPHDFDYENANDDICSACVSSWPPVHDIRLPVGSIVTKLGPLIYICIFYEEVE